MGMMRVGGGDEVPSPPQDANSIRHSMAVVIDANTSLVLEIVSSDV
jgi:hypothetical protein